MAALVAALVIVPLPARAGGLFTEVVAFATKTGYRGVVAWQATQPVSGVVRYGTSAGALDRTAAPEPGLPDTAQMVMFDGLTVGLTYYAQVVDTRTGEASSTVSFRAVNAYTDPGDPYTIDLVAQLDSPERPVVDRGPDGANLADIARGMDIMAERTWDASDGFVRVGRVLVTDTNLDHAANVPFYNNAPCGFTKGNMADFLIQTTIPHDSHTWSGFAIESPCTQISLGRRGQLLATRWRDDLHLGYVATHELMHYAFNSPDLYSATGPGGCANPDWNGSIMHNSGGWAGSRWYLTELDDGTSLTPCQMTGSSSWARLRGRYGRVPVRNATTGFYNSHAALARGNPDGSAVKAGGLEIWVLKRLPGGSTLTRFEYSEPPGPIVVGLPPQ